MPVWIQAKPGTGPGERSRVLDPCGVKGQRPFVNSPRQQPVKDSSTYRSGAGASRRLTDPPAGLLLFSKRGSACGAPSLSLLLTMHPGEGTHPPCTPRCAGGKLLASAAPSPGRCCPFGGCSSRAKSARRSPTGTANRQQLRHRAGAPGVVAPCGG